jgi:hypothetical protein
MSYPASFSDVFRSAGFKPRVRSCSTGWGWAIFPLVFVGFGLVFGNLSGPWDFWRTSVPSFQPQQWLNIPPLRTIDRNFFFQPASHQFDGSVDHPIDPSQRPPRDSDEDRRIHRDDDNPSS